jgi:hypothetical protein
LWMFYGMDLAFLVRRDVNRRIRFGGKRP